MVWTYEAGLVGQHHGLDAVAEVEFGQDARDVGLDGGLSEIWSPVRILLNEPIHLSLLPDNGPLPQDCTVVVVGEAFFPGLGSGIVHATEGPLDHDDVVNINVPFGEYPAYEFYQEDGVADDGNYRTDFGWISSNYVLPTSDCFTDQRYP